MNKILISLCALAIIASADSKYLEIRNCEDNLKVADMYLEQAEREFENTLYNSYDVNNYSNMAQAYYARYQSCVIKIDRR